MKRQDLIRHVESHGCWLLRESARHSIDYNPANNQTSAIPRHREINDFLARKICGYLGIPEPCPTRALSPVTAGVDQAAKAFVEGGNAHSRQRRSSVAFPL